MTTLEEILARVNEVAATLEGLAGEIVIGPQQITIVQGLSDIDESLGTVLAGEFRAGNNVLPGDGFSGVRIAYPPLTYGSETWNIAGVEDDVLQFGLRASDGAAVAGAGTITLNNNGLLINSVNDSDGARLWFGSSFLSTPGGFLYGSIVTSEYAMTLGVQNDQSGPFRERTYLEVATQDSTYVLDLKIATGVNIPTHLLTVTKAGAVAMSGSLEVAGAIAADSLEVTNDVALDGYLTGTHYVTGTWTPTVTQSGSVTVTVNHASYRLEGRVCHVWLRLTVTGSGTAGNGIVIAGQPAAIQPSVSEQVLGTFTVLDAGTAYYTGSVRAVGATDWQMFGHLEAGSLGADPSFALAANDQIWMNLTYQVA
jgi:hypothetical protein